MAAWAAGAGPPPGKGEFVMVDRTGGIPLSRRALLAAAACSAVAPGAAAAAGAAEWQEFRRRFVSPEGRVVDTGNGGISHSEGQGWGMLFAVSNGDRESFSLMRAWTASNLRHAGDGLHAWRYAPPLSGLAPDANNATDGDIFIAAALTRGAARWGDAVAAEQGAATARSILALMVGEAGGRTLLFPGLYGFDHRDHRVVNLSYYAFPFFADLAAAAPSPLWGKVRDGGLALLSEARFGPGSLPPDWLAVPTRQGDPVRPAPGWPARFSYDAVRIPLWLAWSGIALPSVANPIRAFFASGHPQPAWEDLETGAVSRDYAAPGMSAVGALLSAPSGRIPGPPPAGFPALSESRDYYSASLTMLARMAWAERAPQIPALPA